MITEVEGIDGTGKSTQAELLAQRLKAELIRFPDRNTVSGKLIDKMLRGEVELCDQSSCSYFEPAEGLLSPLALQLAMTANRLEHAAKLEGVKLQNELRGQPERHVVLDRYWHSGLAYGTADGLDPQWLEAIHAPLPQPDLHVLLDLDTDVAFRRLEARGSRKPHEMYEQGDRLRKAAEAYRAHWARQRQKDPSAWVVVDAAGTLDEVQEAIYQAANSWHLAAGRGWVE